MFFGTFFPDMTSFYLYNLIVSYKLALFHYLLKSRATNSGCRGGKNQSPKLFHWESRHYHSRHSDDQNLQSSWSEGFYDVQQLFVTEAYINCPTYHLGFVELEKMELGSHGLTTEQCSSSLRLVWNNHHRWKQRAWSDEPQRGKVLREVISLETAISELHIPIQQHQTLWSGMNSRRACLTT